MQIYKKYLVGKWDCGFVGRRGRVQTWWNTLRPDIGNHIEQPASVAEARDRPFVALNRMCRVPDPYSAVALRVSDCLLHSRRSPLCLSFLSEVGLLSLCPRSSAVCVGAFAVRAFFSAGLPLGGPPCIVVSLSPRKGLPITTTPTLHLPYSYDFCKFFRIK